jgi:tetratricopeptide (TPR) repeat protein
VLDFDKAEAYAQQALSLAPQNPDARTISIRVDMARGNAVRADKELARLQKDYPHAVAVSNLVAAQHLFAGRLEEARRAYTASITALPSDHEALEGLVTVNIRMGRKEDAVKRMEDALNSRPPSAQLYTLAGRVYSETGNAQRAEEMLRKSIDAEPHRLTAYGLLGQLYIQQKRLADAKDQYEELVKRNPKSVSANTMLGMLMEALRDSAAEAQYQKTLAIDPEAPIAANNLAWIYVSSNRNLDQALQLAQTALRKQPDSPQVNDTLGWIYYKKGLFSQSVRHLELSVQKNPSAGAHYHLGMAYSQVGDIDKARRSLEKALALSQTFDGAEEAKKTLAGLGK